MQLGKCFIYWLCQLQSERKGERSAVITEKKVFGYGGWIFPRVALARAHHKCTLSSALGAGEFSISGNGNDWNGLCNTSRWRWRQGATNFQLSDSSSILDLSLVWSSLAGSQTEDRIGQAEVSFSLPLCLWDDRQLRVPLSAPTAASRAEGAAGWRRDRHSINYESLSIF